MGKRKIISDSRAALFPSERLYERGREAFLKTWEQNIDLLRAYVAKMYPTERPKKKKSTRRSK